MLPYRNQYTRKLQPSSRRRRALLESLGAGIPAMRPYRNCSKSGR